MSIRDEVFSEEHKPDLTPMIDMVFQLIIFFIVVSDFAAADRENVTPPKAIMASDEEQSKDKVVVVSVLPDGKIRILGRTYDEKTLEKFFWSAARNAGMMPNPDDPGKQVSKLRVVIRADRNVDYEAVQKVFAACSKNGVFRTSISALKEELK